MSKGIKDKTHMSSWGAFLADDAPTFLARSARNSMYAFRTTGIPFDGSKRATWIKYCPKSGVRLLPII